MVFDEIICASDDERFMLEALREAAKAAEEGEVPVGAVVVKDGQIIARAHNKVETSRRSSAHAEMNLRARLPSLPAPIIFIVPKAWRQNSASPTPQAWLHPGAISLSCSTTSSVKPLV